MLKLLIGLLLPLWVLAADVPPLKARVTDLTGTLTQQQSAALEQTLAEFEARKGSQLALLMVPTVKPEAIEQYGIRVGEAWKIGRKKVDDGLILIVAKEDRQLRFEVGYGLEGVIPDAIAKRVIEEDIVPRFRQGDFYGGIRAGLDRAMRLIEGEKLPPPAARAPPPAAGTAFENLLPLVFVVLIGGSVLRAMFGRFLGAGIAGGVAGVAAWFLAGSLIVAVIVGIVGFIVLLMGGLGGIPRGRHHGGWGGGGLGGGGWGGGGGFGGGGGGFGGGGASGRW